MRNRTAFILLTIALALSLISLFGGDTFTRLAALRSNLAAQQEKNGELREYVKGLRREVAGLRESDRVLEKAARNELGMAREDELVFFFDEKGAPQERASPKPIPNDGE